MSAERWPLGWVFGGGARRRGGARLRWPLGNSVAALERILESEQPQWFLWLPVYFGTGISLYFSLLSEPPPAVAVAFLLTALALRATWDSRPIALVLTAALLAAALGFATAKARNLVVAAPIAGRFTGNIEVVGWLELVEPRPSRGERLTIRTVSVGELTDEVRPYRVRVRSSGLTPGLTPGQMVRLKASLQAPSGPALPGGYDFARSAWFQALGAVGFASGRVSIIEPPGDAPPTLRIRATVERLRQAIGARVKAALPGETGAIATALINGERGGISDKTNDAFRDSGLFHILSISGLHMAIMAGAVFTVVRLLLALVPAIALRHPIKKWAAAAAAIAALAYLMISGAAYATVRSYVMITIMLLAVLLDRPAVALRNVALTALVILAIYPESLLDVGFQMSFAAVVALVSVYELIRQRLEARPATRRAGPALTTALFFGGIVLSTVVASFAVAPFAAYHFHKSQQFAVLANLVAIPVCNIVVMPAALATLVAMPFGLESWPLWVMGRGVEVMVWCAEAIAGLPGAVGRVQTIPTEAFALMVAGGLWLLLWRARWRLLGLLPVAAGLALAPTAAMPDVLIGRDGRLIAVRAESGNLIALGRRSDMFDLSRWLEHDGDTRTAETALSEGKQAFHCDDKSCTIALKGLWLAAAPTFDALARECRKAQIVATTLDLSPHGSYSCPTAAVLVDRSALRANGAYALRLIAGEVHPASVAMTRGARPWSPPPPDGETIDGRRSENRRQRDLSNSAPDAHQSPPSRQDHARRQQSSRQSRPPAADSDQ